MGPAVAPRAWRLNAPLVSRQRRAQLRAAIRAGRLRAVGHTDLLAPEGLPGMARASWALLLSGGGAFLALELAARAAASTPPPPGAGTALSILALIAGNLLAYATVLPLHEGVHGLVILLLGGRPSFGLKLPLAAYCTAPNQLFTRAGYSAVALAPLVLLSIAGAIVIWLAPNVGAYLLFGVVGNVAGAVGDLAAVGRLRVVPAGALIEDTQSGFVAHVTAQAS